MTRNQKIAAVLAFTILSVFVMCSCAFRVVEHLCAGASPAYFDYEMNILGDFSLFRRSKNARSIVSKSARNTWIGEDVVRLGWDARFIVCLQNSDWWIIDSVEKAKYGPFDEPGCSAKLRELGVEPPQAYPTPEGRGSPVYFGPGELHRRELE